jgi:ribose 5-phosphate isomerase A
MADSDMSGLKREAAARALDYVQSGMKLGLGTGSTAEIFLELLAERVRAGLKVVGTPTSERTADKARALGIALEDLNVLKQLDLTIDGADEADRNLDLIKGGGGALLREKIVAASSKRMVVIADDSKLKDRLGAFPLPVEVTAFGHVTTAARISAVAELLDYPAMTPRLRMREGKPFLTDSGNLIYDCAFGAIPDAAILGSLLSAVPGVVETGLLVGFATALVIAGKNGVEVLERHSSSVMTRSSIE